MENLSVGFGLASQVNTTIVVSLILLFIKYDILFHVYSQ